MAWKGYSRTKKILLISLGVLVIGLIIFRIMLPSILLKYVNRQLARIDGYTGHVNDIDVALYRGAYTIKGINLDKTGGKIPVPFFKADAVDLSVEWRAIFNGKIVAEIEVSKPILNFVNGPTKETSQTSVDKHWTEVVDKLLPIKLNRFEINDGEVHYRDFHSDPKVDILANKIHVVAENLSNAKHEKGVLPSTVKATAAVYNGTASLDMKLDPLNKDPIFDLNARVTTIEIARLNDFLKAYGNFDVEKGTLSLYTEAAAKNNILTGYTKPIIKDLKVVSWKEDKDKPVKLLWESIVEGVSWLLTNHRKDQLATRADFEGRLDQPDVDTWSIIGQLLRNAFIQALYPSLENTVSVNSIGKKEEKKNFLQKIFKSSDKNSQKKEDNTKSKKKKRKERKK